MYMLSHTDKLFSDTRLYSSCFYFLSILRTLLTVRFQCFFFVRRDLLSVSFCLSLSLSLSSSRSLSKSRDLSVRFLLFTFFELWTEHEKNNERMSTVNEENQVSLCISAKISRHSRPSLSFHVWRRKRRRKRERETCLPLPSTLIPWNIYPVVIAVNNCVWGRIHSLLCSCPCYVCLDSKQRKTREEWMMTMIIMMMSV